MTIRRELFPSKADRILIEEHDAIPKGEAHKPASWVAASARIAREMGLVRPPGLCRDRFAAILRECTLAAAAGMVQASIRDADRRRVLSVPLTPRTLLLPEGLTYDAVDRVKASGLKTQLASV